MKHIYPTTANPGPLWGYRIIALFERWLPSFIFNGLLGAGTFVALFFMKERRRHASDYWQALTGRPPGLLEQFRHFRAFMDGLVLKLKSGRGVYPDFHFNSDAFADEFMELCRSPRQALFGTFHVGHSDMMGCMLKNFDRRISLIRLRVGNSWDTDILESAFAGIVRFLWINNPDEFIFQLKGAVQDGQSIGMQCDRTEFSSKMGAFDFLGTRREFPVTIYHLASLFKLPVVLEPNAL